MASWAMGLFFNLVIIVAGLLTGGLVGRLARPRIGDEALGLWRRRLQAVALLGLNPLAFVGALWSLPSLDPRLALLPLVGLATLVAAFGIGALASRLMGLDPERALLFRTGISYTNIGNLGGLSVFLLVGEAGYALLPLYKLFEELWIYGFLFPHTKEGAERLRNPGVHRPAGGLGTALVRVLGDPFLLVVLGAVVLGFALHLFGPGRPGWYGPLNAVLVPASSFLLLVSLGLTLRLSVVSENLGPALVLGALKVTTLPLVSVLLSGLAGFWGLPTVWKTALVLSAMPMAFLSLVPPALYGLDEKFPATAWAVTMVTLAITLPVLSLVMAW